MTLAGKVGATLFFLIFAGFGFVFIFLIGRELLEQVSVRSWTPTPCVITHVEAVTRGVEQVSRRDKPYAVAIAYEYTFQGQSFTSTTLRKDYKGSDTYEDCVEVVRKFSVDSNQTCYVDPNNPSSAVLELDGLWFALMLLLPLLFVVIGLGGIWGTWRMKVTDPSDVETNRSTVARKERLKRVGPVVFFLFFLGVGLAFIAFGFLPAVLKIIEARSWVQTPCQIISSSIVTQSGDDGSTYRVDIFYSYVFNDREYKSSQYQFSRVSSSGYQSKADVVRQYPAGREALCYVDPDEPSRAVIDRGWTADLWFMLIPGVFVLVGAGGVYNTLFGGARKQRRRMAEDFSTMIRAERRAAGIVSDDPATGLVELRSQVGPLGKLVFAIVFSLFWNGIVSVFVTQAVRGWVSASPDYCLSVFMLPFVVIGLGAVGFAIHSLLALRNPRVVVRVSGVPVFAGEDVTVEWELTGAYDSVERVTLTFSGARRTRQGKKTTSTELHKLVVVDETRRMNLPKGRVNFVVPTDARPTDDDYGDDNTQVEWKLSARAFIPNWPDTFTDFPLRVLEAPPLRAEDEASPPEAPSV